MTKYSHLSQKKAKKKVAIKKLPAMKFNIQKLNIGVGVLIFVFAMSHLIQINGMATKGYQIRELEGEIHALNQIKSDLELEALSLQSMGSVKEKVGDLNMVAIGETEYLDTAVSVAIR